MKVSLKNHFGNYDQAKSLENRDLQIKAFFDQFLGKGTDEKSKTMKT